MAKEFLKYFIQPKVNNEWLKVGLGRNIPVMPSIVKNDPWWYADPHRKAYTTQGVLGPTIPAYWAYNPAYAEVQNTHVWSTAWLDIIQNGTAPQTAADNAYKRDRGDLREIPDHVELSGRSSACVAPYGVDPDRSGGSVATGRQRARHCQGLAQETGLRVKSV